MFQIPDNANFLGILEPQMRKPPSLMRYMTADAVMLKMTTPCAVDTEVI